MTEHAAHIQQIETAYSRLVACSRLEDVTHLTINAERLRVDLYRMMCKPLKSQPIDYLSDEDKQCINEAYQLAKQLSSMLALFQHSARERHDKTL